MKISSIGKVLTVIKEEEIVKVIYLKEHYTIDIRGNLLSTFKSQSHSHM